MFHVGHLPRGARHRLRGKAQPDSAPYLDALSPREIWTLYQVLLTPLSTSTLVMAKQGENSLRRLTHQWCVRQRTSGGDAALLSFCGGGVNTGFLSYT